MIKKNIFLIVAFLMMASFAIAQDHARGSSSPGLLGKADTGKDNSPPIITITEPAGVVARGGSMRGIKIVPKTAGELILRGIVEDDRAVGVLRINGQKMKLQGTLKRKKFGVRLKPPKEGSTKKFILVATDKTGNTSEKTYEIKGPTAYNASIVMKLKSETETQVDDKYKALVKDNKQDISTNFGRYWALVIGVSEYNHPSVKDLEYAVLDAQDVADVLTQYYTFDPDKLKLFNNPIRAELIKALSDYSPSGTTPLSKDDNLLVFYAGHGYWDKNYREGYWLPSDAEQNNRANWVSNSDVQRAFRGIQAKHILLLSDACFSGSLFATRQPFSVAIEEAFKESSRKAITAGNLSEVPDRSVFKEYLVKRLKENRKDYLDAGNLYNSIKAPVTNNSPIRQRPIYGVIQQTGDEGGEFIFVRRKK